MKNASPWQLLLANPLMFVPWLVDIAAVAFIQSFTSLSFAGGDAHISLLLWRYLAIALFLSAAYSTCMAKTLLDDGAILFSKASRLFWKSVRRIFLAGSLCFFCVYMSTSMGISGMHKTLLIAILAVAAFLSTYCIAAVVVGGKGIGSGIIISAKLVARKFVPTLLLYIAPIINVFIVMILFSLHVLSMSNTAVALPVMLLFFSPTLAVFSIAVVEEYCLSYDSLPMPLPTTGKQDAMAVDKGFPWVRVLLLTAAAFCILFVSFIALIISLVAKYIPAHVARDRDVQSDASSLGTFTVPHGFKESSFKFDPKLLSGLGVKAHLDPLISITKDGDDGAVISLQKNDILSLRGNDTVAPFSCRNALRLPDDRFSVAGGALSFPRFSCMDAWGGVQTVWISESGTFPVQYPRRHEIMFSATSAKTHNPDRSTQAWDPEPLHELIRSFYLSASGYRNSVPSRVDAGMRRRALQMAYPLAQNASDAAGGRVPQGV